MKKEDILKSLENTTNELNVLFKTGENLKKTLNAANDEEKELLTQSFLHNEQDIVSKSQELVKLQEQLKEIKAIEPKAAIVAPKLVKNEYTEIVYKTAALNGVIEQKRLKAGANIDFNKSIIEGMKAFRNGVIEKSTINTYYGVDGSVKNDGLAGYEIASGDVANSIGIGQVIITDIIAEMIYLESKALQFASSTREVGEILHLMQPTNTEKLSRFENQKKKEFTAKIIKAIIDFKSYAGYFLMTDENYEYSGQYAIQWVTEMIKLAIAEIKRQIDKDFVYGAGDEDLQGFTLKDPKLGFKPNTKVLNSRKEAQDLTKIISADLGYSMNNVLIQDELFYDVFETNAGNILGVVSNKDDLMRTASRNADGSFTSNGVTYILGQDMFIPWNNTLDLTKHYLTVGAIQVPGSFEVVSKTRRDGQQFSLFTDEYSQSLNNAIVMRIDSNWTALCSKPQTAYVLVDNFSPAKAVDVAANKKITVTTSLGNVVPETEKVEFVNTTTDEVVVLPVKHIAGVAEVDYSTLVPGTYNVHNQLQSLKILASSITVA